MTKNPSLSRNQGFSTQANETVAENNNLLAAGEAKPWPLCIKPSKVRSHFPESALFYPEGTAAPDRLEHHLQNVASPLGHGSRQI